MAKLFCDYGFASTLIVGRHSLSALIVIAGNAIAAYIAATRPDLISIVVPIADINRARKDASITGIDNENTDSVARKPA